MTKQITIEGRTYTVTESMGAAEYKATYPSLQAHNGGVGMITAEGPRGATLSITDCVTYKIVTRITAGGRCLTTIVEA